MIKSEVLDALLAAGATAEMIVAAVKADMAHDDARREAKREGNAERQRRFKAKRKGNGSNALPSVTPPIEEIIPPVSSDEETRPVRKTKAGKAGTVAKPDAVSEPVWRDFVQQRKTPVSETAIAGIEDEARKAGWTLNAAIAEAVARGWQSFKADWVTPTGNAPPGTAGNGNSFLDHLIAKDTRQHA